MSSERSCDIRAIGAERERMRTVLGSLVVKIPESDFRSGDPAGVVADFIAAAESPSQLDIEIAALFVASISWGNRKAIRKTARRLLFDEMLLKPERYVMDGLFEGAGRGTFAKCVYRTLDFAHFQAACRNLREALRGRKSIEDLIKGRDSKGALEVLCRIFEPAGVGTPGSSPCKRMCMFMRWMTRREEPDFGIWKTRDTNDLLAVMDVHVNRQTQSMRKCRTPSWKGCLELTDIFKSWDPDDPLKYDIALMMLADSQPRER